MFAADRASCWYWVSVEYWSKYSNLIADSFSICDHAGDCAPARLQKYAMNLFWSWTRHCFCFGFCLCGIVDSRLRMRTARGPDRSRPDWAIELVSLTTSSWVSCWKSLLAGPGSYCGSRRSAWTKWAARDRLAGTVDLHWHSCALASAFLKTFGHWIISINCHIANNRATWLVDCPNWPPLFVAHSVVRQFMDALAGLHLSIWTWRVAIDCFTPWLSRMTTGFAIQRSFASFMN